MLTLDKITSKPFVPILLLTVLCAYLFFFDLGAMALTDPDESFYAETAREMFDRHEWSTPYLYGKPQFEKPILFYWLVEASFRVFGVNEFAARLPSAILGLVGVIAMYLLGAILFNRRVGLISAAALASCVEYVILSRACVTDMALAVFMLLGVLSFFYGRVKSKGQYYLLSSAAFALAVLTKGPVFLALPLAVFFIYVIVTRDWEVFKPRIYIIGAILVFFAVSLPWYILMIKLHGKEFVDVFFGFHNITRFMESEHKIGSQWYYNIPVILGGFFPWSVFLPFGLWHILKKCLAGEKHSIFVISWLFVIFAFFSISSTKLPTYIFPAFLSAALAIGILWDDFLKRPGEKRLAAWMRISYYLMLIVIVLGSIIAAIFVAIRYPSILGPVAISCLFLMLGAALSFFRFIGKRFDVSFLLIIYAVMIFMYPFNKLAVPKLGLYETSQVIAEELMTRANPEDRFGSESNYLPGIAFYTGKIPADLDKHHELVKFVESPERVWFVLKEKNHIELYTLQTEPFCRKASYIVFKLGKKVIATNKMPADGKYLIKRERVD